MSAEINTEQLLVLVKELKGKDESRSKWYVGPMVTVLIAVITAFVSWGMMMKTTEFLQTQLEQVQAKVSSQELEIVQLKISQTKNDTMLVNIKDTVGEIKLDVGKLVAQRTGGRHEPR